MSVNPVDELYPAHLRTVMKRTDESLQATGYDALVVQAGTPPVLFLDDQDYPYKVNPHFKSWVPLTASPRSFVVYKPGERPRVLLHRARDFWHQPTRLPDEEWTRSVDLSVFDAPADASPHWQPLGRVAFIGADGASGSVPASAVNDGALLARLHFDRAVKTPYEIECLRQASAIATLGHEAAESAFRDGCDAGDVSEYDVHMAYLAACRLREEETPYNNIVAFNEHAAVLHYQHLDRTAPVRLRSLLIDAGAQYRGYASDVTRTYAAPAAGRYAELIDLVDAAQLELCAQILAGHDYREVHLAAHRLLGTVLQRIGLTRLDGIAAMECGLTSVFFPHGIGHLLGLQVHDVGGVMGDVAGGERRRPEGHPHLRLTRMLEPGVVVTVEPGLYFIDSLLERAQSSALGASIHWDVVEELQPYGGIRIEDNVVTTTSVPENLTRDAFAR